MELSAEDICGWMLANKHRQLCIEKEEQQDLDKVQLQIAEIRLVRFQETQDDYVPSRAIVIRGEGTIETGDGQKQDIPQNRYEIPVDRSFQVTERDTGLVIHTERAQYYAFFQ